MHTTSDHGERVSGWLGVGSGVPGVGVVAGGGVVGGNVGTWPFEGGNVVGDGGNVEGGFVVGGLEVGGRVVGGAVDTIPCNCLSQNF